IIVMAVGFAGALHYPITYFLQQESNETAMDDLRTMRVSVLDDSTDTEQAAPAENDAGEETSTTGGPVSTGAAVGGSADKLENQETQAPAQQPADAPDEQAQPTDAPADDAEAQAGESDSDRSERYETGHALPYPEKEQVQFSEDQILPQYRDIYELNNDLVGWLHIPGTVIDYPVVRNDDPEYYLDRDFYGKPNSNGQLILDSSCDVWTPSYNLVISGHNMNSGRMFAQLCNYSSKEFWSDHKTLTFDTLLREGEYVIIGAFFSADYDENEEGFRYNADIQYRIDATTWLNQVKDNSIYQTGIDAEFGDEFLTLTTCQYHRADGRFVVVARRVREGEVIR
ncbi:MAG: sortase, partial [Erysipelotrichaceae bacterium]|nr:sortase [Erysipelotrichaceae bacterium]